MKRIILAFCLTFLPFIILEFKIKDLIFHKVAYTNVDAFDAKIDLFQKDDWNAVFIGSSETHWGVAPSEFTKLNSEFKAFNFGLNGMIMSKYINMLPYLYDHVLSKKNWDTVFIGFNIGEPRPYDGSLKNCQKNGDFEKPIYLSSFAKDSNLFYEKCKVHGFKDGLLRQVDHVSNTFRYRIDIKDFIFRDLKQKNLEKLMLTQDGFHYRKSMAIDLGEKNAAEEHFTNIKNQNDFSKHDITPYLKEDGFINKLVKFFKEKGKKVVIFNTPTNPRLVKYDKIDQNLNKNIETMTTWAKENDIRFINIDEVQNFDLLEDYADRRHLGEAGAKKFSKLLAKSYFNHN